ncbi:YkvA family protein [Phosphitispora sp. TUW77]|uniref:YkvA family protein n=1 Tax=Phosphitispora sp. TUW77 TaxID=3152361 RepID=UPI003AB4FD3E
MGWLDREVAGRLLMLLNLPKSVPLVWNLVWDKRVTWIAKLVFPGAALAYFLLPYDLIPDWIPLLGQVDDLTVMFLLIERFVSMIPDYIVNQYQSNLF